MDFYKIKSKNTKQGISIFPSFNVGPAKDFMVQGKSFYAIWDSETNLWSTNEFDVARIVDQEMDEYAEKLKLEHTSVLYLSDFSSNSWRQYKSYLKEMPNNYHPLDTKVTFRNTTVKKSDYISKRLPYDLQQGECPAYEEMMNTLYEPEERAKIEWAIGSIISGDSKSIQKFIVLYGQAGTGKSTILNIIEKLFDGYCVTFDAKDLATGTNAFAGDAFASNPLVAIQHDGDLSSIKDNSLLNTIVAHEKLIINEKFKSKYELKLNSFLFMGTNKPVKITDAKSGLIRRVIDVHPTGKKLSATRYGELYSQIDFELGAIAAHCLEVYEKMGKSYYSSYRPLDMMYKTDEFFNFVEDSYFTFSDTEGISLKRAYEIYKLYCENTGAQYKMQMYKFREELKNYFNDFLDRYVAEDGTRERSYYKGFKKEMFEKQLKPAKKEETTKLSLKCTKSLLDDMLVDCPAQYANDEDKPYRKWADITTTLANLDTSKCHYVRPDKQHIVIDFDLKDKEGNKCLERNLEAAAKWPATYAEISKGGSGVHLHYIYDGDVTKLSKIYDEDIEIKVFTGNSSLRRRLSKCNNITVNHISTGLPLSDKKGGKMVNFEATKTEKGLRAAIIKNLHKEVHSSTKCSVDFIYKILEDAYNSELKYDVSDMRQSVLSFAMDSTNQAEYCVKLVGKMHFRSEEESLPTESIYNDIIFYDIEVFPNLFIVNWKKEGDENPVIRMINPSPEEIGTLFKYRMVGFNNRRYDNHIVYARYMGYSNEELYRLSQKIISGEKDAFFREAYNLSYTDVYDYAAKKQSLKKWEIELGIHHQELGLPWNQPVPESLWEKVAEYCDNDVIATEVVWNATKGDFIAREILAEVAGMTVNDTTNTLTTRIIFGSNREPQNTFNYRFMGEPEDGQECKIWDDGITCFQENGKPVFIGYKYENGKSTYMSEEVGEGGYVYAKPGMYSKVITFDVASMHPSSVIAECLFGEEYTKRFQEILQTRIYIKHKEFDKAKKLLNGALGKYLTDEKNAKALAQALKIAINSVYGLTSAKFMNPFRDMRNKDNIVAKRGALFMINLKHLVTQMGGNVVHIKTDSIKVEDPSDEIISFILDYGKKFGYNFEVEHKFEKICLVNNAVYVAKLAEDDPEAPGEWTATGTQFAVPYVFKTLFTHEPIIFDDVCETKSVTGDIYLDMNEDLLDTTDLEKCIKLRHSLSICEERHNTKSEITLLKQFEGMSDDEILKIIDDNHNYVFVGKVGRFCPVKVGYGGGILYRYKDDIYASVSGTKGYRWKEAESIKNLDWSQIDESYYKKLVDEAVDAISQYGDLEWFIA